MYGKPVAQYCPKRSELSVGCSAMALGTSPSAREKLSARGADWPANIKVPYVAIRLFKGSYTLNIKGEGEKHADLHFQSKIGFGQCHIGDQVILC